MKQRRGGRRVEVTDGLVVGLTTVEEAEVEPRLGSREVLSASIKREASSGNVNQARRRNRASKG